jgi:Family of unknown function (DUF5996)
MTDAWPPLELDTWRDTLATLHMWTQVAGKVALARTPRANHFWNIAMVLTARGLSTHTLTHGSRAFTILFDFVGHTVVIHTSDGRSASIAMEPKTVADFYREMMDALARLDLGTRIWTTPVEIPNPIPFERDTTHRSYDRNAAARFWQAMTDMRPVFESFRWRFIGKSSPVHFFWGSFDLASTRFSGRRAPERPGADAVTRESYSHEVISHGFWPGGPAVPEPVFYAYAAPEPAGFSDATVRPPAASYNQELKEFLLPYDAVRRSPSPSAALTAFLESTYEAGANAAGWNRQELERS